MGRRTLTTGQATVLECANADPSGWVRKGDLPGHLCSNVDQLERRGLLRHQGFGVWGITREGRAALSGSGR